MISFANPWGLLALLAVPAIIAIHLYRRRFPRLIVAGSFLWGGETEVRDAGRSRDRLPITATLVLELLAAILLAMILAQPRFGAGTRVEHLVVVLDDTASMEARSGDGLSVRDRALAELESRMKALGRKAVVTVVTTGPRPALLVGPAAIGSDVRSQLRDWRPRSTDHDPASAWDLAVQLAGDEGRLLYLTDAVPADDAPLPQPMEVVALGRPAGNVAISGARWQFDPASGRGSVSLRIERSGRVTGPVTLTGTAGGQTVFTQEIDVDRSTSTPFEFAVPGGLQRLEVDASFPADPLPLDSRVTLIEPQRRLVRVAMAITDDHSARKPIASVLDKLPAVELVPVEEADLVVASGQTLPEADPNLWWLGIGPLEDDREDENPAVDLAGPYVIDKRDPLTEGVTLDGVAWGGATEVPLAVTPLISAGRYPLLARLDGTPTRAFLLNLDLNRSNIADSPDWPILIANLVSAVRDDQPGLRRWNYRSGETIAMRLPSSSEGGSATLTLTGPRGDRSIARSPTIEISPPATPGVYTLRDGETTLGTFAVNFQDDVESDLTTRRSGRREPPDDLVAQGTTPDTIYSWFVLAAITCVIAAIAGDWYVLRSKRGLPTNHTNRRE